MVKKKDAIYCSIFSKISVKKALAETMRVGWL